MTPETAIQTMWVAWWVSWLAAAAWSDRAVKRSPTRHQIVYRLPAGVGAVLLFGLYRHDLRAEMILWPTPLTLAWALVSVVLAGLLFTWWARIHLGRLWSSSVTRKADHRVVDTGPYGIVRHPIYAGIILASVATAAMRGTALAWLGACVMTAGWVIKARLEEEFLREQLGVENYGEYAQRVPMLVPLPGRKRSILSWIMLLVLSHGVAAQSQVEISLKQGTPGEDKTREQLQRLLATYDLSPWIYTKSVVIDERAIPFSHPVLTLHTRHAKDDDLLLSTFLHEQLHWFFTERAEATQQAIGDLRKVFQTVPVGGTAGARDEESTYLHLMVCYLEQQADVRVLGELRTKQVMDFWATDHYTWVYQTVSTRSTDIGQVMRARNLVPAR